MTSGVGCVMGKGLSGGGRDDAEPRGVAREFVLKVCAGIPIPPGH